MKKRIGLWMYRNDGGQIIQDRLRAELERRGFVVVNDFDMRECYCLEGRVRTRDGRDLSSLDAFYHMNADEQTPYQNDILNALERSGVPVVNSFAPFANAKDKFTANQLLRQNGVRVPPSLLIGEKVDRSLVERLFQDWGSVLMKPRRNHGGSGIVKISDAEAFMDFHQATAATFKDFYVEKYLKFSGQDYRVEIFDGRCISGYSRRARHSFKTNIGSGGRMVALPPGRAQCKLALRAAKVLGVTTTIVDMIRSEADGELYVLEVNPIMGIFLESAMKSGSKMEIPSSIDPLFATDAIKLRCIADFLQGLSRVKKGRVKKAKGG